MSFLISQIKVLETSAYDMEMLRSLMREPEGSGLSKLGTTWLETAVSNKISEQHGARILGVSLPTYKLMVKAMLNTK